MNLMVKVCFVNDGGNGNRRRRRRRRRRLHKFFVRFSFEQEILRIFSAFCTSLSVRQPYHLSP